MRFVSISKLLIASALALASTLGVASAQTVTRTLGPLNTGNKVTSITIPARDPSLPPMTEIVVTVDITVTRTYAVGNFSPIAPGIVEFNSPIAGGTYQRAIVKDPFGSFLCTAQKRLDPRIFNLGVAGSGTETASSGESFHVVSTQISTVNPATFTGTGDLTLPVVLDAIVGMRQFSGDCLSRQSWTVDATITVTYQ